MTPAQPRRTVAAAGSDLLSAFKRVRAEVGTPKLNVAPGVLSHSKMRSRTERLVGSKRGSDMRPAQLTFRLAGAAHPVVLIACLVIVGLLALAHVPGTAERVMTVLRGGR